MDAKTINNIIEVIDKYLDIYFSSSWPSMTSSETDFYKIIKLGQCMESIINSFRSENTLENLISELQKNRKADVSTMKVCLTDPPKHILKKIIVSDISSCQVDVALKIFMNLFSEERLESCLTDIMVEAASYRTLLNHLSSDIDGGSILEFKSLVLLSELKSCENITANITELIGNCDRNRLEILLTGTLNESEDYSDVTRELVKAVCSMLSRNSSNKNLWKVFFSVKKCLLHKVCLKFEDIFEHISHALIDCGKLIQEEMSSEYFYIDLTYEELKSAVAMFCEKEVLKSTLYDHVCNCDNVEFWNNMFL